MIRRITIENYMAHKSTTLDLAQGVTVITGPNNTGKSAIVEAIRSIAQNPPTKNSIRHGAKSALVRMELDTGETIEWVRTDKSALYNLTRTDPTGNEGTPQTETFAKFGRTPPEAIRQLLRLDPVETETGAVDIHIGNQRYPIFLLDQAGSQAASFFAASTEAEYLLRMQQALKRRTDRTRSRRKELLQECERDEKKLERFAPLGEIASLLCEAESLYEKIGKARKDLPAMQDFLDAFEGILAGYRLKSVDAEVLESLTVPPKPYALLPMESLCREIAAAVHLLETCHSRLEIFFSLKTPPVAHEVPALEELVHRIENACIRHEAAFKQVEVLQRILSPPQLQDAAFLKEIVGKLQRTANARDAVLGTAFVLQPLSPPPALLDIGILERITDSIEKDVKFLSARQEVADLLEPLTPPPVLEEVLDLESVIRVFETHLEHHRLAAKKDHVLQGIDFPPDLKSLEGLKNIIAELENCGIKLKQSIEQEGILQDLRVLPALQKLGDLDALLDVFASLAVQMEKVERGSRLFGALIVPPLLNDVQDMRDIVEQIHQLERGISENEKIRATQQDRLMKKRQELEETLLQAGACPLCGHPMDIDHFLGGMHA
ncbi:AAA family ATPase [Desulforhabdus amnigena]|jgi:exonuclease SbcC|uniref:Rad50/SbcC-type AAA domain-containing protein n=1 Tax=Desulforhabdus amnigena TaxID=40218 RepID=A0A9W6L9Y2_9BACT|nr:AAA family ATPase [Desulforhabdus amnigena]NLJ29205.1 AAA family ATPase [Deltaproteobacteria bacterium]GLI35625.1 hypothetical protein DAMNIGENAA_30580 [Desulforhabdus amnigena]